MARTRRTLSTKLIDYKEALRILEEEAALAETNPVTGAWVARVQALSELCLGGVPRTHIAMLGTALLAKATNPNVDVFALKAKAGTPGAYTARSLAKDVLAAKAPRLGIDLGVSGREPLNNQPYFRGTRIDSELEKVVRADAIPAFRLVVDALAALAPLSQGEARHALRAFLQVRKRQRRTHTLSANSAIVLEGSFASAIDAFVSEQSDGGKRAQAVVAGLLDVMYSSEEVLVARVNDPDRRFPGDVAIAGEEGEEGEEDRVNRAYEVRDKPVTEDDLYHFVDKVASRGVDRAGVVATSDKQRPLSLETVMDYAQRQGVKLAVFVGWERLINDVLFYAHHDPVSILDGVCGTILARLEELEAPDESIQRWVELVDQIERVSMESGVAQSRDPDGGPLFS